MSNVVECKMEMLSVGDLVPHPMNRDFVVKGEEWKEFKESIKEHGVITPLIVRPVEEKEGQFIYQVLAGHRRRKAAMETKRDRVPCIVRDMDDKAALMVVLIENLERKDLDPVQEGRGVRSLIEELGFTAAEVAGKLKKSLEWVETRQGLLDLPEEVLAAVRAPRDDRQHLSMGAVQEILRLEFDDRVEAVQLVLHNGFQDGALNSRQAKDVIRRCIVEPKAERMAWEKLREKAGKAWRKTLKASLPKGAELTVRAVPWEERSAPQGAQPAESLVPLVERLPDAPDNLRWLDLAAKHGLPVLVVPDADAGSAAVVNARIVRAAEESAAEFCKDGDSGTLKPWLVTKKSPAVQRVPGGLVSFGGETQGVPEREDHGELPEEEQAVPVIEQKIERRAWLDIGPVALVVEILEQHDDVRFPREQLDGRVPDEIMDMALTAPLSVRRSDLLAVCKWVLSLRSSAE